jgi:homoserine kinase
MVRSRRLLLLPSASLDEAYLSATMKDSQGRDCARAYAPGGIGNIGPGLDVLGCALTGVGDVVQLRWSDEHCSELLHIEDAGHELLPRDPRRHAASIAALAVLRAARVEPKRCLVMQAHKALPLAGGQGGSAASAVAGAVAANALLGDVLDERTLLLAALESETALSGRHADNIAPALLGGVALVRSVEPLDVVRLPFPKNLRVAVVHPSQQLRTRESRAVLPPSIDRATVIRQCANVAALVWAFVSGDLALLGRALDDAIAEPARAPLLPGFAEAKAAALEAGALGCSISGAGPSSFAFAADDRAAESIARAMAGAYEAKGVAVSWRIAAIDAAGARLL